MNLHVPLAMKDTSLVQMAGVDQNAIMENTPMTIEYAMSAQKDVISVKMVTAVSSAMKDIDMTETPVSV
jgi:hypothetical protein